MATKLPELPERMSFFPCISLSGLEHCRHAVDKYLIYNNQKYDMGQHRGFYEPSEARYVLHVQKTHGALGLDGHHVRVDSHGMSILPTTQPRTSFAAEYDYLYCDETWQEEPERGCAKQWLDEVFQN